MTDRKLPIVAIVGRANVGKSSLFNAILKRREAIVAREAGTTRDSLTAKAEYAGKQFWLVDTAGMKSAEDDFELTIQEQISQAAEAADIIWVVIEADVPITDEDRRVANLALKSGKPVFLVVNKVDKTPKATKTDYQKLGIKDIFLTSTTQNRGIEELLSDLVGKIPKASLKEASDKIRLAILGRPNVGKSSLFNSLNKKQQAIVADRAGTTRDINRNTLRFEGQDIEIMDTAGIRRRGKIEQGVEQFSVLRALSAIEQADICLVLMDVNEPSVAMDQKIAGLVKEAGKGLVLVISKWDAYEEKTPFSRDQIAKQIKNDFSFAPWASLIFTSSITGQNVTKIFEIVTEIMTERQKRIGTNELNKWLRQAVANHTPAGLKNHTPKLNYIVQEDENPSPSFKIFGSQTKFIHWSYRRYLERDLRQHFGFAGTPVQLWFIEKHVAHKHGQRPSA